MDSRTRAKVFFLAGTCLARVECWLVVLFMNTETSSCGTVNSKAYDSTFRFLKQDSAQFLPNTILLIFFFFVFHTA